MIYRGHIQDGAVVLDDQAELPEGAAVRIELVEQPRSHSRSPETDSTLGQKLMKYAGKAVGLPEDAAKNHDHYLYGTPKK